MVDANDFYEDDEPIEAIRAILARPADGVTAPPGVVVGTLRVVASGNRLIERAGVDVGYKPSPVRIAAS